jgi:methionyl-tRNA formyltransferase
MRFGFVTCVQLGLACMEEIYEVGGRLDFAMSLRDDQAQEKSGRIYLDGFCGERGIPLSKVGNVNDAEAVEALRAADLDWLFIIGWSQIARAAVLAAPKRGALGMHPTLLPEGRGRAAIPWAILKGLPETGVTLFQLDEGVDTGPILAQETVAIRPRETAGSLYERVDQAHRTLIRRVWRDLASDRLSPQPQDLLAGSVWPGRKPEDGRLDPTMSCAEADRLIRAVSHPYPGAFIDLDGRRLRVWAAEPGDERGGIPHLRFFDGGLDLLDYDVEDPS